MKLTFNESGTKHISEVFGMTDDQFEKLVRKLVLIHVEEQLTRNSHKSKTQLLHDWLETNAERDGFKFETAADFFMLGFCFHNSLEATDYLVKGVKDHSNKSGSSGIAVKIPADNAAKAKEIIKQKIREAMSQIKEATGTEGEMIDVGDDDEKGLEILPDDHKPKKKLPN